MLECLSLASISTGQCLLVRLASTPVITLSGAPFQGRLLALPTNIRLSRKGLSGTSTQAYYEHP